MMSQNDREDYDRIARLCEAKDAEIKKLRTALSGQTCFVPPEFQQQLSEAQAQIAMQSEALKPFANFACDCGECFNCKALKAISATSETVAAWRAKETEPLRREVATLVAWVKLSADGGYWTGLDDVEEAAKNLVEKMQATALAYEREVKAKALEKFKADYKLSGYIVKESQEQEPVCWRREWNGDVSDFGNYVYADNEDDLDGDGPWQSLYPAPVIPPDVQEVMDELLETSDKLEELQRENAELRQQNTLLSGIFSREEELTKLLDEAKSKAVPEGWQIAYELKSGVPTGRWQLLNEGGEEDVFVHGYWISAVPQPETAKCKSCGGNDEDAPCAYPGEYKHGCLRDARMTQPETDIDQAQRFK